MIDIMFNPFSIALAVVVLSESVDIAKTANRIWKRRKEIRRNWSNIDLAINFLLLGVALVDVWLFIVGELVINFFHFQGFDSKVILISVGVSLLISLHLWFEAQRGIGTITVSSPDDPSWAEGELANYDPGFHKVKPDLDRLVLASIRMAIAALLIAF